MGDIPTIQNSEVTMQNNDIERFEVGELTVRIVQDYYPESPRKWDNLGEMYCWHQRYILGDKHQFSTPDEFQESDEYKNAAVILPLFLYDHGVISMSCGSFSCPWDSGQVGYIVISKDKIRSEYGCRRISKARIAKVTEYLKSEVNCYDEYLTGQVYGYIVEDSDGNNLDSCWGFYGFEHVREEGKTSAEYWIEENSKIDALSIGAM
jgi:hypothetical protein